MDTFYAGGPKARLDPLRASVERVHALLAEPRSDEDRGEATPATDWDL